MAPPMIDPALFDQLKDNIEKDSSIRKDLEQIIEELNQNVSYTQGVLTKIHSTPRSKCTVPAPELPSQESITLHVKLSIQTLENPSQTVFYLGICGMRHCDYADDEFLKVEIGC